MPLNVPWTRPGPTESNAPSRRSTGGTPAPATAGASARHPATAATGPKRELYEFTTGAAHTEIAPRRGSKLPATAYQTPATSPASHATRWSPPAPVIQNATLSPGSRTSAMPSPAAASHADTSG